MYFIVLDFTSKWEFICFTLDWGFGEDFFLFFFFSFVCFIKEASFNPFCWEKSALTRFLADCLPDRDFIPGLSLALVKDRIFLPYHPELWMILFIKRGNLVLSSFIVWYMLADNDWLEKSEFEKDEERRKNICEPMDLEVHLKVMYRFVCLLYW